MSRSIDVTVAAVIERDERFLLVEEQASGRVVYNQPAGHLEPDESLLDAVVRETLEESGHRFHPQHLLGIYVCPSEDAGTTYLRIAFTGAYRPPSGTPQLDDGIVAVHWLTRNQLLGLSGQLRSPMVLRCIDDYRAGVRFPLDCVTHFDLAAYDGIRLA